MFKVSLHHLAPDCRTADPAHGDVALGEIDSAALGRLLDNLRQLDPVQNHSHDPHLATQGPGGRLIIRLNHGKLFAYDARNTSQVATELDGPGVIAALDRTAPRPSPTLPALAIDEPVPPAQSRRLIGLVLLVVGVGLNGLAAYLYFQPVATDPAPAYEPVTAAAAVERQHREFAGSYATGGEAGDRTLLIRSDGTLVQQQIGAPPGEAPIDSYVAGLHEGRPCLVVTGQNLIALRPDGALVYSGDVYHRIISR